MTRWMYIMLGSLGAVMVTAGVILLCVNLPFMQRYPNLLLMLEWLCVLVGAALAANGFIQGKRAGEMDIRAYMKTPPRDHHVAGTEIGFHCPSCQKEYRGSPLLAGKPFTCRECHKTFEVPRHAPQAAARRADQNR